MRQLNFAHPHRCACTPPNANETPKRFRKRIYSTLHTMVTAATSARAIRIEIMHPNHNWPQIWCNLHDARIPDMVHSVWHAAIHDIMPTKERLHGITLTDTNRCTTCGQIDTLLHRMTDCGVGKPIWNWTQTLLARTLNTRPQRIPGDWTIRPQFHTRSMQRHAAILWILAHLVYYRTQYQNRLLYKIMPISCAERAGRRTARKHIKNE